ncbi:hypothetical protein [Lentibacillus sediminis]|uniref:hypothetical protein n=1 Tax=Lentibacillus sediminis TaxID=1940529 RepID=UPI000C1C5004|nr:hypothetical protein [Lentibacillus sediminis]
MKSKRILILSLCFALVMSCGLPVTSFANASNIEGNGIEFTEKTEDSWEYIQEKDGETYKVIEHLKDESSLQSYIYKLNNNGNYILQSELQVNLTNDNELVTKEIKDGETTVTTEDVSGYAQTVESNNSINDELGEWVHLDTTYGQKDVGTTVGAVSLVLSIFIPKPAALLVNLAALVIDSNTPTVYYREEYYNKYLIGTTIPAAEMQATYLYADPSRSQHIGTDHFIQYYN